MIMKINNNIIKTINNLLKLRKTMIKYNLKIPLLNNASVLN